MRLYKKIDNYLLHHFPNIWATRIHVFLPIGIIFMAIVYAINVYGMGYHIKQDLPDESGISTLIIPGLIFLVVWFVFQARYNVEKSGGRLSILGEYFNYFLYFLIFATAILAVTFVDYTNDVKVSNAINDKEFMQDIKNLNIGNVVMNKPGEITKIEDGYRFPNINMLNNSRYGFSFRPKSELDYKDKSELGFEHSFSFNNDISYYVISRDKELFRKINSYDNNYYTNSFKQYNKVTIYDTAKYFENYTYDKKYLLPKEEFDEKVRSEEIIHYKYEYEYGDSYYNLKDNEAIELVDDSDDKSKVLKSYYRNQFTEVSKSELFNIINNYAVSYNKYSNQEHEIMVNPEKVLASNMKEESVKYLFPCEVTDYNYNENDYVRDYDDDYNSCSYYEPYHVENKIEDMDWVLQHNHNAFFKNYIYHDIYKGFLFFLAYLALLVWIFKQMHWKNYVFGIVALALTPLVMVIFAFLFNFRESSFSVFIIILYILVFVKVMVGYFSSRKNKTSIVSAMYLQFFLPVLPLFIFFIIQSADRMNNYDTYDYEKYNNWENYVYWIGLAIGLISIMVFKPIYRKMSLLPNNK